MVASVPMSSAAEAPDIELVIRPSSPWSIRELRDLWQYRELFWILALRDVAVRYKQAFLGVAWALLQPAAQMVIFTVLFNRLAGIRGEQNVPYPVFCLSGLVVWQLFSNGLNQASESLIGSSNLITKVFFPRVIIPVATILAALVDFLIGFAMLVAVMCFYGVWPHLTILWTIPLAMMAALSAISIGLWTSAINLQYRDVRYALPFFLQLLVYLTPVFYPISLIPERYRWIALVNPMSAIVEAFRAAVLGMPISFSHLAVSIATILSVGFLGYVVFRSMERTFADRV